MSKKGENIFLRKDGRWEARYIRAREMSGKIRYGFCYGRTYREAKGKAEQLRVAMISNQPVAAPSNRHRFSHFCGEWLSAQRAEIRESTYVKYEIALRRHILPRLGGRFPQEITTKTAEDFKIELLAKGLSVQSVKNILMVLHSVLSYTAKLRPGLLPAVDIHGPKEQKREPRALNTEEQRRFAAYLYEDMDPCKFGVLLALSTGLRIGEICALRWENISLREGTVRVTATMQRLKNVSGEGTGKTKIVVGSPKSDTSIRIIPLPDSMAALCARMAPRSPAAYVLTGTEAWMEPRTLQYRMKRYTEDCGLEGVHFHTLRHTFATRCMEAGFDIKSLSEILGHARTSTTLDRYVHSSLETKRKNMAKLDLTGMETQSKIAVKNSEVTAKVP